MTALLCLVFSVREASSMPLKCLLRQVPSAAARATFGTGKPLSSLARFSVSAGRALASGLTFGNLIEIGTPSSCASGSLGYSQRGDPTKAAGRSRNWPPGCDRELASHVRRLRTDSGFAGRSRLRSAKCRGAYRPFGFAVARVECVGTAFVWRAGWLRSGWQRQGFCCQKISGIA
jgi:hypothetical protein